MRHYIRNCPSPLHQELSMRHYIRNCPSPLHQELPLAGACHI
jgi:hypothetical protein